MYLVVCLNDFAIEPHRIVDITAFHLPRVSVLQPWIGKFNLIAIDNALCKDTILVSKRGRR